MPALLPMYSYVTLIEPFTGADGVLPVGAVGIVVFMYPGGVDCEVEFHEPFQVVECVPAASVVSWTRLE